MTFRNAKKLHNEDEVTIKETGRVLRVLNTIVINDPLFTKAVFLECDDGNTYRHTDIR